MKKFFKILGIVIGSIVGLVLIVILTAVIYSKCYKVTVDATHENNTEFIQAYGRGLYDTDGNEIVLQGTNFGGWLVNEGWLMPYTFYDQTFKSNEPDQPQYLDETGDEAASQNELLNALKDNSNNFTDEDINDILDSYYMNWLCQDDVQNVKDLGLNCIRVPFGYKMILNDDLTRKDEEVAFKYLDMLLEWCENVGDMYVVLDLHTTPGSHNGYEHSGVEEYASGTACVSYIHFWENETYVNAMVDLWKYVSEHYSKSDNLHLSKLIAMYDLFNEPLDVIWAGDKVVWDVMDKVYDALRDMGDEHVICLEGCWSFAALPDPATYGWTNVCYSYHWYNFVNLPWTLFYGYQDFFNIFCNYEVPVFQGEFTFFEGEDNWEQGLNLFKERHYSWTTWTYKKVVDGWWNDSWGIYDLHLIDHDDIDEEGVAHIDSESYIYRINLKTSTKQEIIDWFESGILTTNGNCNIIKKVQFGDSEPFDINYCTYDSIKKHTGK